MIPHATQILQSLDDSRRSCYDESPFSAVTIQITCQTVQTGAASRRHAKTVTRQASNVILP